MTSLLLGLLVVGSAASGHILLKAGMIQIGHIGVAQLSDPISLFRTAVVRPYIWVALFAYGASFLMWAVLLSRIKLSIGYPLLAVLFVIVPVASLIMFNEPISTRQWVGIVVISVGVLLATGGIVQ